jgi:hypothetical protein
MLPTLRQLNSWSLAALRGQHSNRASMHCAVIARESPPTKFVTAQRLVALIAKDRKGGTEHTVPPGIEKGNSGDALVNPHSQTNRH